MSSAFLDLKCVRPPSAGTWAVVDLIVTEVGSSVSPAEGCAAGLWVLLCNRTSVHSNVDYLRRCLLDRGRSAYGAYTPTGGVPGALACAPIPVTPRHGNPRLLAGGGGCSR